MMDDDDEGRWKRKEKKGEGKCGKGEYKGYQKAYDRKMQKRRHLWQRLKVKQAFCALLPFLPTTCFLRCDEAGYFRPSLSYFGQHLAPQTI